MFLMVLVVVVAVAPGKAITNIIILRDAIRYCVVELENLYFSLGNFQSAIWSSSKY